MGCWEPTLAWRRAPAPALRPQARQREGPELSSHRCGELLLLRQRWPGTQRPRLPVQRRAALRVLRAAEPALQRQSQRSVGGRRQCRRSMWGACLKNSLMICLGLCLDHVGPCASGHGRGTPTRTGSPIMAPVSTRSRTVHFAPSATFTTGVWAQPRRLKCGLRRARCAISWNGSGVRKIQSQRIETPGRQSRRL